MKVTIVSIGRFHVADLARELIALGHEVVFHSIVPPRRLEAFGIPLKNQRCHLMKVAPLVFARRYLPLSSGLKERISLWIKYILDNSYANIKDPGDFFIGMSGLCVKSLKAAKNKGAKVLLERGSRHILSQKKILENLNSGSRPQVPEWAVTRELAGYKLADRIVVGSQHVLESFLEYGFSKEAIFKNNYGVDLEEFPPTPVPKREIPRIVMVGKWCLRKGCDVLLEAWMKMEVRAELLHVGPVDDAPLSNLPDFIHLDAVDQKQLKKIYAEGNVFALASREEGLALVQPQALSCGLHVVCTDRCGGADLASLVDNTDIIRVVPHDDANELARALDEATTSAFSLPSGMMRDPLGTKKSNLSWRKYGERYSEFLAKL